MKTHKNICCLKYSKLAWFFDIKSELKNENLQSKYFLNLSKYFKINHNDFNYERNKFQIVVKFKASKLANSLKNSKNKCFNLGTFKYNGSHYNGLLSIIKSKEYKNKYMISFTLTNITTDIINATDRCEKKLKESVFSKIAHELKTPNLVLININNQICDYIKNNQINKAYDLCLYSISFSLYMNYLVNDLIQFYSENISNNIRVNITSFKLETIIVESFNILNCLVLFGTGNKKIITSFNIDKRLKDYSLTTDYMLLMQVLCHLISNAAKFTKQDLLE